MKQPEVKWDDEKKAGTKKFKHTAVNRKTGQRIGSNDGRNWFDLWTGEPYPGEQGPSQPGSDETEAQGQ